MATATLKIGSQAPDLISGQPMEKTIHSIRSRHEGIGSCVQLQPLPVCAGIRGSSDKDTKGL